MIGLEYIAKEFHLEYKEIAERLGISPQTLQDWLKQRRKIPKQRLEQLSNMFKLPESYFQKELDHIEKAEIKVQYLQSISESIEVSQYNEAGEIFGYYTKGTYEAEVQFLKDDIEGEKKRNCIRKGIENLIQEEIALDDDELTYEGKFRKPLLSDSSNTATLSKVINIMKDTKVVDDFKVIVHLLNADDELGGNITSQIHPEYRSFAKEFLKLVKKYGIKT